MAGHSVAEIQQSIKVYISVFAALAVLTIVTVAVSYLHLTLPFAVAVALLVASIKGGLVAAYFMHLLSERGVIFWILGFTIFFFLFCLIVPTFTDWGYLGH